ncbi:MAG: 5'-nucleotidase [Saprospiraceae bacterium]
MSKYKLLIPFLILGLLSCKSYYHFAQGKAVNTKIVAPPDSAVSNLIAPYKISLDAKMNTVLAQCPVTLTKERPESTLTNWVADALHHQASLNFKEPIAFVFQNFGGIRIPELAKGDVTLGKIYELMPFDNVFLLVKLTGADILKFANYIAEGGGSSVSSSLRFVIENKKAMQVTLNQQPVVSTGTYYVGLPDYIANGGDNLAYLKDKPRIDHNILVRDMLANEAKSKGVIESSLDHRISISK